MSAFEFFYKFRISPTLRTPSKSDLSVKVLPRTKGDGVSQVYTWWYNKYIWSLSSVLDTELLKHF